MNTEYRNSKKNQKILSHEISCPTGEIGCVKELKCFCKLVETQISALCTSNLLTFYISCFFKCSPMFWYYIIVCQNKFHLFVSNRYSIRIWHVITIHFIWKHFTPLQKRFPFGSDEVSPKWNAHSFFHSRELDHRIAQAKTMEN